MGNKPEPILKNLSIHVRREAYSLPQANPTGAVTMLSWQERAYDILKSSKYGIVQAPSGSGKSLLQVWLASNDIVSSGYTQKQLIVVPQNHVHRTFIDKDGPMTLMTKDGLFEWAVTCNACIGKQTTQRIKEFLLNDNPETKPGTSRGLVALATHQAFVMVWQDLSDNEKAQAIARLTIRIDEAHHVKGVVHGEDAPDDPDYDPEGWTKMGEVCTYVLSKGGEHSKLHLTTATFFRGDQKIILSPSYVSKFDIYALPWNEFWDSTGIDGFDYEYYPYDVSPIQTIISMVRDDPSGYHLVILPAKRQLFRSQDTLKNLLEGLEGVFPGAVLDLVTKGTQKANKYLLLDHPDKYRAVVAVALMHEATNWVPCSKVYNTVISQSITRTIQKNGRAFRSYPGKNKIWIGNFLPSITKNTGTLRERLSDRMNAAMVAMMLGEMFYPVAEYQRTKVSSRNNLSVRALLGECYDEMMVELFMGLELSFSYNGFHTKDQAKEELSSVKSLIGQICINYRTDAISFEDLRDYLYVKTLRLVSVDPRDHYIDVGFLRKNGFDVLWPAVNKVSSLFYGTKNDSSIDFGWLNKTLFKGLPEDLYRAVVNRNEPRPVEETLYDYHRHLQDIGGAHLDVIKFLIKNLLKHPVPKGYGFLSRGYKKENFVIGDLIFSLGSKYIPEKSIDGNLILRWAFEYYRETSSAFLFSVALEFINGLDAWEDKAFRREVVNSSDKREITKEIYGSVLRFKVGEDASEETKKEWFKVGHEGIARVNRCHLSENFMRYERALCNLPLSSGFMIPVSILCGDGFSYGAEIPSTWVTGEYVVENGMPLKACFNNLPNDLDDEVFNPIINPDDVDLYTIRNALGRGSIYVPNPLSPDDFTKGNFVKIPVSPEREVLLNWQQVPLIKKGPESLVTCEDPKEAVKEAYKLYKEAYEQTVKTCKEVYLAKKEVIAKARAEKAANLESNPYYYDKFNASPGSLYNMVMLDKKSLQDIAEKYGVSIYEVKKRCYQENIPLSVIRILDVPQKRFVTRRTKVTKNSPEVPDSIEDTNER
jgi:hypothetical protein